MGVLAECWQTPYSATSHSHCAVTGIRIGMPPARSDTRTSRIALYHRLYRGVPSNKHPQRRGGLKDDSNSGTRSPAENTQGNGQDRTCIEGENRPLVLSIDDLHSVPKAQRAGRAVFIRQEGAVQCDQRGNEREPMWASGESIVTRLKAFENLQGVYQEARRKLLLLEYKISDLPGAYEGMVLGLRARTASRGGGQALREQPQPPTGPAKYRSLRDNNHAGSARQPLSHCTKNTGYDDVVEGRVKVLGVPQFRYNDKQVVIRKQVTGAAVERPEMMQGI
ncbi:hypothetical protein HD554DRAFT_2034380 [Boletus coccyginus]|nr:hypothetical protein HD554DRAFT_2034380 [Boletus coccyginus]